jgi:hypothetical protein
MYTIENGLVSVNVTAYVHEKRTRQCEEEEQTSRHLIGTEERRK